jgi:ubiquinol-cytochrome c reductase subunit 8
MLGRFLTGSASAALSPFQAKTMPNYVKKWLFNGYRRLSGEAVYFLIPFGLGECFFEFGVNSFLSGKH